MIIQMKDTVKFLGISIVATCAVFVCNLFMNYNIDIALISDQITNPAARALYDAQCIMSNATCGVSGGVLLLTSVVLLFFYISQYIDAHSGELGIMKALGYSRGRIASQFLLFGVSVLVGTLIGYVGSFLLMPAFYHMMNQDDLLPNPEIRVNFMLCIYLVLLPTLFFGILAVAMAYRKLKRSALSLLREEKQEKMHRKKKKEKNLNQLSFLSMMKKCTVTSRPALLFFVAFGAFCYGAMIQMSESMSEYSSLMTGIMIFCIGIVLAFTSLLLAVSTVVGANTKNIAMMKVMGYSFKECTSAVLGGYRYVSYVGFLLGTIYQYVLMKIMVGLFSSGAGYGEIAPVTFKWDVFLGTLLSYFIVYEIMIYFFSGKIKKVSIKKVMVE